MDRYIGNVLELLDELDLADNTIVIFSSDNGTTHLEKEVDYEFFNSVGELRGLKGSLHEGGIRVPTIVRYPGKVKAGTTSDHVGGFEDWIPTVLELIGKQDAAPENIDGISLAPTLLGEKQLPREFLYREFSGYGGQQMVRVGDWKAIRTNLARGKVQTQLYNLMDDIGEKNNVAAEHPDVVAKLEAIMTDQHTPSKLFPLQGIDP
jgi:arylsulfatase A-like enzyme